MMSQIATVVQELCTIICFCLFELKWDILQLLKYFALKCDILQLSEINAKSEHFIQLSEINTKPKKHFFCPPTVFIIHKMLTTMLSHSQTDFCLDIHEACGGALPDLVRVLDQG